MSDAGENGAKNESPAPPKASAAKDRNCPFCGQAFTSSSLGRHLDLYIKEKNPKPSDGIHDVAAIRKMRGTITRRQPRGSLARRDASTPATPTASTPTTARRSPGIDSAARSSIPKDNQFVADQAAKYPFQCSWEVTGVMNDLPSRNGNPAADGGWHEQAAQQARRPSLPFQQQQRVPDRNAQKYQLDSRQKLADAIDTAKAAELALREMMSSWRAAKSVPAPLSPPCFANWPTDHEAYVRNRHHIDMNSLPFDFDPLALDFPALALQCLQPPPTLFSSTPHPTSTSWSIQPPAQKQYEALEAWFQEEFRKWRVACAAATTAVVEDLTYPPSQAQRPVDLRESVKKAEEKAQLLETQVNEHLQSTYQMWEQLPDSRKSELWTLELARSVGRRQKEVEKLKESQHFMTQETTNLKTQIGELSRLQQPREFRVMPPATVPFEPAMVSYLLEMGLKVNGGIGFNLEDRHLDVGTLVSRAIERWKNVVTSSRGPGMSQQRPLEQPPPPPQASAPPVQTPCQPKQAPPSSTAPPAATQDARSSTTGTATSASAANDDNSDEDADAEMDDDDSFAPPIGTTAVAKAPAQQQDAQQLEVPRTRGSGPKPTGQNDSSGNRSVSTGRAAQGPAGAAQGPGQRSRSAVIKTDYGTPVSAADNTNGDDPMYMD